jgi:Mg2+/citrate symporter
MVSGGQASEEGGKLTAILTALRKSAASTRKYFIGTTIFYLVLIAVFAFLVGTVEETKARGADIGILILVSLGFLGMWISALRGLRGTRITIGGLLNLYRLPLVERLAELEDDSRWNDEEERLQKAMELLEHQAAAEREHRAWPNRALSLAVITIIDLLIWLVWDNWVMALINQGIAMIVSMTHISMGPKSSIMALEELEREE